MVLLITWKLFWRVFLVKGAAHLLMGCYFNIFLGYFFPSRYDFFLCSQSVRQGTVTPTHFNVVKDESRLSVDNIQLFTYKLCHMYYNWPVSVTHISYRSLCASFLFTVFVPSHFASHTCCSSFPFREPCVFQLRASRPTNWPSFWANRSTPIHRRRCVIACSSCSFKKGNRGSLLD